MLVRTALVLVGGGAAAGAGSAIARRTAGVHETITIAVGDSITPRFSVRTDSVLTVVGSRIVARRCGQSAIYLRTWRGAVALSADTITATVACAPPPPAAVDSVGVCFIPPDSAVKYGIDGSKTLDSATLRLVRPWCKNADTLHRVPLGAAPPALQRKA
jgi:hypothetical protein